MTATGPVVHVAVGGCDEADGSQARPLASPAAAIDLCRHHGDRSCIILLHGGRYDLAEPLRLGPEDSGLTLEAAPGETPVLYGGCILDGWQPEGDGPFWWAPVPGPGSGTWDIRQLYVNGQARPNARLPQTGTWLHETEFNDTYNPCFDPPPSAEVRSRLVYGENQLPGDLSIENVQVVVVHSWDDSHTRVVKHDPETRTLWLEPPCTYPPGCFGVQEYYVLNLRQGMTRPGQWMFDRSRERVVYWPLPGERPDRYTIEVPRLASLVHLEGSGQPVWENNVPGQDVVMTRVDGGRPVTDITIRGLTLELTSQALIDKTSRRGMDEDYPCSHEPGSPGVWSQFFTGAVMVRQAHDCRLEGLKVRRCGGQGIKLLHTQDVTVEGCTVAHCGAGGIASNVALRTAIVGNHVQHVGELRAFSVGIHGINWSHGRIADNDVSDCTYCGITLSNGNRETPIPAENVVEHNHVHNVMNELDDGGCIYMSWSQRGTVVRGNVLHGSHGRTGNGSGLYLDIGVDGVTCEDNLVYDIDNAALHVHMAADNTIRHNVFVCGDHRGISFMGSARCVFERNIVIGRRREILFLNPEGARFAGNLYWSVAGAPVFVQSGGMCASQAFPDGVVQAMHCATSLEPLPRIDTTPDDVDWQAARTVALDKQAHGQPPPVWHRAEVRLLRQDGTLWARFRVEQPPVDDALSPATTFWQGEICSLCLAPCGPAGEVVQFGVARDGRTDVLGLAREAEHAWHASVRRLSEGGGWEATLCIPPEALAVPTEGNREMRFFAYNGYVNPQLDFAGWQAAGRDVDGGVAEPGFVDAPGGDFRTHDTSPARRMGFTQTGEQTG